MTPIDGPASEIQPYPPTRANIARVRKFAWTRRWRELDSNLRFRARVVSVLPLRDQMLASRSSSGEPGEVPFHGQVTSENLPITMIAPAEAQPAPHTSSPGWAVAIGGRRSYAKTTSRTELERVFTSNGDAALRRSELESPESDQIIAARRVTIEQQDATFRTSSHSARPRGRRAPAHDRIADRSALVVSTLVPVVISPCVT